MVSFSFGQTATLKEFEKYVKEKDIARASFISDKLLTAKFTAAETARYNYLNANLYALNNKDNLAYRYYIAAKDQYKAIDSLDQEAQINIELVSLLLAIDGNTMDYQTFLHEYIAYAQRKKSPDYLSNAYMQAGKSFYDRQPLVAVQYFKKAERENLKTTDDIFRARILLNMGATYATDSLRKFDLALNAYREALKIYEKHQLTDYISYVYINYGVTYTKMKAFDKALFYFFKADSIPNKEFKAKTKEALYGYMTKAYEGKGDYKNALAFVLKQKELKEQLDEKEQKKAINENYIWYKTKEKEKENLALKDRLQTNRIIVYAAIGLLLLTLLSGILIFKNISKKKKIAVQEKLIETQKLEKVLKEQELAGIDLMLESQEKERQRIANELHDNLGSLLATLKLNFQNISRTNQHAAEKENQLYHKTDALIEEAYQEVRNISHLKNLGVVGKEGLLLSVKKMAEKMSILNKLQMNVIPFGLTERLENSVEVILFRIIQELCTNIIKHSEATEVNIYLNQHDEKGINIMIEDNGKGFVPAMSGKSAGIGLKSIEKKVEQMNGTFTIDSVIGKGTTIIIDIPL